MQLRQLVVFAELFDGLELPLTQQALERDRVSVHELGVVESSDRYRRSRRGRRSARGGARNRRWLPRRRLLRL